tara:strand:+ start:755 stop:1282 length:528 start_codon:yes stop_codon:yes gene_type:complete
MGARRLISIAFLPTGSYAQIIDKEEPILVQPPLEHRKHQFLEIFRTIGGAERQTSRQPTPSSRQDSHLLLGVRLIVNLIEPFFEVTHRDELVASDRALDVIRVRDQEELPLSNLVKLTVVHHHTTPSLNRLIGRSNLRREGGETPLRVPFLQLPSLDILLNGLLYPLSISAVQPE